MLRSLQTIQLSCLTEHLPTLRGLTSLLAQQPRVASDALPINCPSLVQPSAIAQSASVTGLHRHAHSISSVIAVGGTHIHGTPFSMHTTVSYALATTSMPLHDAGTYSTLQHNLPHPASQLRTFHSQRHLSAGGARKVIEQQQQEEKKEQENLKAHQTQFDRSLGARKAKNAEHQSVIAHMSDVRTPRSLLNKSTKQTWEVG